MILNTVRRMDNDQAHEQVFGDKESLQKKLAVSMINPVDFNKIGLTPSLHLKISDKFGAVIVKVFEDEGVPQGSLLMPVSIWANQLTGVEDGVLTYKNIGISVEATKDPIMSYDELLNLIKKD